MQLGFNCRECDSQLQKERGCVDNGLLPFDLGDERIFRCPLKLVTNMSWQLIQAYAFYKKNLLPNGSSYLAETQKYIDAMFTIDTKYAELEEEQIKKAKR